MRRFRTSLRFSKRRQDAAHVAENPCGHDARGPHFIGPFGPANGLPVDRTAGVRPRRRAVCRRHRGRGDLRLDLGSRPAPPGAKDLAAIDQKIAALLGTDVREIAVTDMVVHPQIAERLSVRHAGTGCGREAGPDPRRRRRQDRGRRSGQARRSPRWRCRTRRRRRPAHAGRTQSITDMAFVDGRLYMAGLSNEEFASKLRSVPYPFSGGRQRHQRGDLPRQPRAVRDALARLHVRAVHGEQHAAPDRAAISARRS